MIFKLIIFTSLEMFFPFILSLNPIFDGNFCIFVKNTFCKHVLEFLKEYFLNSWKWFQKNVSPFIIYILGILSYLLVLQGQWTSVGTWTPAADWYEQAAPLLQAPYHQQAREGRPDIQAVEAGPGKKARRDGRGKAARRLNNIC